MKEFAEFMKDFLDNSGSIDYEPNKITTNWELDTEFSVESDDFFDKVALGVETYIMELELNSKESEAKKIRDEWNSISEKVCEGLPPVYEEPYSDMD